MPSTDDNTKAYNYDAVIPIGPITVTSLTEKKAGVVQVNNFRFVFHAEQRRKLVKSVKSVAV